LALTVELVSHIKHTSLSNVPDVQLLNSDIWLFGPDTESLFYFCLLYLCCTYFSTIIIIRNRNCWCYHCLFQL